MLQVMLLLQPWLVSSSAQGDGRVSEDIDTESPTKKSRSDGLGILPLQTHQPFRLQVSNSPRC